MEKTREEHLEQIYAAAKKFWQDYHGAHNPEFNSEAELLRSFLDYEHWKKTTKELEKMD